MIDTLCPIIARSPSLTRFSARERPIRILRHRVAVARVRAGQSVMNAFPHRRGASSSQRSLHHRSLERADAMINAGRTAVVSRAARGRVS